MENIFLRCAVLDVHKASVEPCVRRMEWLKRPLVQAAWAASHTKNSYLASQYRRLVGRRGKKRALIAVGHSILVILYYLLKEGRQYADLGSDFFDRLEPKRLTRYYVNRLPKLGH